MSVQGSPGWFAERCGKVTASRVADLMAKTKTGWGSSRANYMAELIAERMTGIVAESYTNAAMQWGTEHEAQAKDAYQFYMGFDVEETGFVPHGSIENFGASPDGLVGPDGLVEIKCPLTATHIETLLSGTIPGKYVTQMHSQMACTGRKWNDFISFDPRMPESLRLFRRRLQRDEKLIAELENEVQVFLKELVTKIKALEALNGQAQVA
jgi:YqaJ-like viral recombinase domain.